MSKRLAEQKMLLQTLTTAISYAERLGFDAEVDVMLVIKQTIARRAHDERELARLTKRSEEKDPSGPPSKKR